MKKRILVTGATGAIGTAICGLLANRGYDLILTARDSSKLEALTIKLKESVQVKVEWVASDFSDPSGFGPLIEVASTTGITGLVVMPPQLDPTPNCLPSDSEWIKMFTHGFVGPVALIREVLPALKMRQPQRSKVVIISGISSVQVLGHYATSNVLRTSWVGQAKTLAHFYGPEGIHFNTLSLGGVMTSKLETKLESESKQRNLSVAALIAQRVDNVPLRKYASVSEVADATEALLGTFSDHFSGHNFVCDGGFTRAY